MKPAADTLESRIRERAYHIWEANGRPAGRDKEFWHRPAKAQGATAPVHAGTTGPGSTHTQPQGVRASLA
jgi:hypothetical protein